MYLKILCEVKDSHSKRIIVIGYFTTGLDWSKVINKLIMVSWQITSRCRSITDT
jgi:hypothetical protein